MPSHDRARTWYERFWLAVAVIVSILAFVEAASRDQAREGQPAPVRIDR